MDMRHPVTPEAPNSNPGFMMGYLEALSLVERLHRLLLDDRRQRSDRR